MDFILQTILIISAIFFAIFILLVTKKKQLSYRFTLLWLFFSLIVITVSLFPQIIVLISKLVHIETPVNALFLMAIVGIIIILFFMTIGYTKHSEKITKLIQTNAILEKRIRELEEKEKT